MENKISWKDQYKVSIPEGTSGNFRIKHVTVSEQAATRGQLRAAVSGSGRCVPAGVYTMLYYSHAGFAADTTGELWMSDTPDEISDHLTPVSQAKNRGGHVLINGLGIGMVTAATLKIEEVEKVTVIESSQDVINLVAPSLLRDFGPRLEIVQSCAYEFRPPRGTRYSVVWHDIWMHLCTDNLELMAKLHRKYGRRCDWQGSWGRELLLRRRRQERSSGY